MAASPTTSIAHAPTPEEGGMSVMEAKWLKKAGFVGMTAALLIGFGAILFGLIFSVEGPGSYLIRIGILGIASGAIVLAVVSGRKDVIRSLAIAVALLIGAGALSYGLIFLVGGCSEWWFYATHSYDELASADSSEWLIGEVMARVFTVLGAMFCIFGALVLGLTFKYTLNTNKSTEEQRCKDGSNNKAD